MKKHFSVYLIGICGVVLTMGLIVMTVIAATGSFRYRRTKLVIKTGSANKMYDGRPLVSSAWSLVSGKLSDEHELVVQTTGSQIDVGKSENYASVKIVDTSGLEVTDQYDIEILYGDLEVNRRKLCFRSSDETKIWDGIPFSVREGSVQLISGRISVSESWEVYGFQTPTDVGTYSNTYQIRIVNADQEDITDNYEIEYECGTLTIQYGYLVLSSDSASKVYDGENLTDDRCRIVDGKVAAGHKLEMHATGSIWQVGLCRNEISVKITDDFGEDVTKMYSISFDPGLLTVTPRKLVIQTLDVTRPYSDTPIQDDWVLVAGELVNGDVLSVMTQQQSQYNDGTGMFDNTVSYYTVRSGSYYDVSNCYQVSCRYGRLILTE